MSVTDRGALKGTSLAVTVMSQCGRHRNCKPDSERHGDDRPQLGPPGKFKMMGRCQCPPGPGTRSTAV